jgi:large repetitive protein
LTVIICHGHLREGDIYRAFILNVTELATAEDDCQENLLVDPNLTEVQLTGCAAHDVNVLFTADDGCDNRATCVQTFSLLADVTPPDVTCEQNRKFECGATVNASATAEDNCDPNPTLDLPQVTLGNDCSGSVDVTVTATDICSNEETCQETISWEDTTPPTITFILNVLWTGDGWRSCIFPRDCLLS